MNLLILSCGTRNKIIQYLKKEFRGIGQIIAADSSYLAPALYDANTYVIIPEINDEKYIDSVLQVCKEYKVDAMISLIDPELSIISKNLSLFQSIDVFPIVSDEEIIELCMDKYNFNVFLGKHKFNTIKSYIDLGLFRTDYYENKINFPVFIKPRKGSASINNHIVSSIEEIEVLFNQYDDLIIQEYMKGIEIGVDVYIDLISKEPVAIFSKEKLKMRAGETDKAVSFKDEKLFRLINDFLRIINFKGMIDIDLFKVGDEYYISEVNPRFGGGYPLAYESGVNFPKMILNNLRKIENVSDIGNYGEGITMMKYNDVKIIKISNK